MSQQPTNNSDKPSAYINIAATVNPMFTCCLSSITNRNIANTPQVTPASARSSKRKFSFAHSEGYEEDEERVSQQSIEVVEDRE